MDEKQNGISPEACRRNRQERRREPTPVVSKHTFKGERRSHRRQGDKGRGYYVDRPQKEMVLLIGAIGVLCALDAVLTLYHLGRGAVEINPVVNYYLTLGSGYFFLFKALITIPALIILLLHQNFYYIKKVVTCIGGLYSLVVVYHLLLFVLVS